MHGTSWLQSSKSSDFSAISPEPVDTFQDLLVTTPAMNSSTNFLEDLPPTNCPPSEAEDKAFVAWRFVSTSNQTELAMDHFLSFAALGEFRPGADPCVMRACSLFASRDCSGFKSARRLPKLRAKHIAEVSIPNGAGQSLENNKGHISFWMYSSFSPMDHVQQVIENDAA